MPISLSQELLISSVPLLVLPLLLLLLVYLYFRSSSSTRSRNPAAALPRNWPVLHMFPSLAANLNNLHDFFAMVLAGSGHSFRAHGPPGTGMRFFVTCDPANVRHVLATNHANFLKGAEFAAIFDVMGGSLFTVDGEQCRRQRAKFQSVVNIPRFVAGMAARCRDKVENGLLPLFARMASAGTPFDVQEVLSRFMFDLTAMSIFGVDPGLVSSSDVPLMDGAVDAPAAMDTVMEVAFFRHTVPACCWKVLRWLNIGPERKLSAAHAVLQGFVTEMIERRKIINGGHVDVGGDEDQEGVEDLVSSYIDDPDYADDGFLRATLIGSMLAGKDTIATTLPWAFYNLAQNPRTVSIIRNELSPIASRKVTGTGIIEPEETKSLVYVRAALYETLRLYPPASTERKTVVADDTMPSGHEVCAGDIVLISIHSMGRMEDVWGKGCLDYNPDRWLSEDNTKLRYIPSHKFMAFNSGPRICPGKEIAMMQMKTIVAAVVWNFDMEVVEGQSIKPKLSCSLQMKNGLTIKLKKREI